MLAREKVEKVIGKTFADRLDELVFDVGIMQYSRRQMVEELGCANFVAAARLQKVLRRLGIKNGKQLYNLDPFSLARSKGIGEASLFVAMCILDSGDLDVIKWWQYKGNDVKFSSFKRHAISRASKRKQEVA
jgi:hypothetical protein